MIAQLAAEAFNTAARGLLAASQGEVARTVGETPQKYSDCLHGREGSLDRVHRWLVRWREAGKPPMEMVVRADKVEVRPVTS